MEASGAPAAMPAGGSGGAAAAPVASSSAVAVPVAVPSGAPAAHGAKAAPARSQHTLMLLQMLAGAGAGAAAKTATAPLERIKILFQVQGMQTQDLVKPKYTGITQAAWTVVKEEGFAALWKGNGANVLRVIPVYGLKFAFNDSIKAVVAGPTQKRLDATQLLWVGTLAGLLQTALTYPLETVRTRLSLGPEQGVRYAGINDCFRQIVRVEGWAGLFKGFGPTMVSGAPYTGIQMTTYELMKRNTDGVKLGLQGGDALMWQLINGAASGLVAQTFTYPGDTVRRRMQNNGAGGAPRVYRNSFHCTAEIWRKEGMKGFFKGAWTNTVRAVPGAAVQFAAYEALKDVLKC